MYPKEGFKSTTLRGGGEDGREGIHSHLAHPHGCQQEITAFTFQTLLGPKEEEDPPLIFAFG